MSDDLLTKLLYRGDEVSVEKGVLIIKPKSGKPVPSDWLNDNYWHLVEEILDLTGGRGYRYDRFTRSDGGYNNGRFAGITLHYEQLGTGEEAYLMFNAKVTVAESKKLRPGKSFLPPERGSFIKFWKRTIGDLPQGRRSKCCESMGLFKPIVIELAPNERGKGRNKTAMAVEISSDQIRDCLTNEIRTDIEPDSDRARTEITIHGSATELDGSGLETNPSTCSNNHDLSYQDSALTRQKVTDEWLRGMDGDPFSGPPRH